jgi:triacylglycerol lipase
MTAAIKAAMWAARWAVTTLLLVGMSACSPSDEPVPATSDDAKTVYPIVLAHGLAGFDHLGPMAYWRGIPEALQAHGAQVFVTSVSAFNSSEVRGQQLLAQVEQIVAQTGQRKVNLIGHSHGSQSIRYVAAMRPDLVASVTAVAGPTTGSETADWMMALDAEHPWVAATLLALGNGLGHVTNVLSGADHPQDARAAMWSLSAPGAADFNRRHPAGVPVQPCQQGETLVKNVHYYSWSGVGTFYNALNPADYLMALTSRTFVHEAGDGLVGRCSSHLGQVIRDDYPMNHMQAVNLFWGLTGPGVDPVGLYVEHARRLKQAGL